MDARRTPKAACWEWTGLFLLLVGVYGTTYRGVTRHLAIWGVVPLYTFYLVLLLVGVALLLRFSPHSPFFVDRRPVSGWARYWRAVRALICLVLVTALLLVASN